MNKDNVLIFLIIAAVIDTVVPVPIMTIILLFVYFQKPAWFKKLVDDIYQD
ncbi:hypothetical protein JW935_08085 [candidate division KSB1 bacterium]|nr:hypothetical protein [candidate division KSB1 bacterium]